jgi:hypothetical protein
MTEDRLVGIVRMALEQHDLATLDVLANRDGASRMKRRVVSYQLRYGLGRPFRSITSEPFPADGSRKIEERGTLKPKLLVSQQLRVVFDERKNPLWAAADRAVPDRQAGRGLEDRLGGAGEEARERPQVTPATLPRALERN